MVLGFVAATTSQVWFEVTSGWWPFGVFTFACAMSFGIALPLSFTGRGFDLGAHRNRVRAWQPVNYPNVDIFLPICNEPIEVLRNTWEECAPSRKRIRARSIPMCSTTVWTRLRRWSPGSSVSTTSRDRDRGVHKKSGNLRYAFANTAERVHRHPGRRLRPEGGLPGRNNALHGRPEGCHRPDSAVLSDRSTPDVGGAGSRSGARGVLSEHPGLTGSPWCIDLRRLVCGVPARCFGSRRWNHLDRLRGGRSYWS